MERERERLLIFVVLLHTLVITFCRLSEGRVRGLENRGKRLHVRNQHLRNHRRFPVACSNGLSAAFSNGYSRLQLLVALLAQVHLSVVTILLVIINLFVI